MGVPPALPGRQQKFDISGSRPIDETPNREPPSTRKGVPSMDDFESLSHTKWECKYHVVFIPKCRRKTLYVELRRHLGEVFRRLAEQKESRIEEGHLLADHVHMLISIPPKYAVSQVVGFIKGKSAIHLARVYGEKKRNFVGQHFWARGYFVSTVGRDTEVIRDYIRRQEEEDKRLEQMNLWR
jgi:putative transposase